jgi:hypothetical protein
MHEICIDYLHWLVYHTDASMKKTVGYIGKEAAEEASIKRTMIEMEESMRSCMEELCFM